jgi:hypothetical protein
VVTIRVRIIQALMSAVNEVRAYLGLPRPVTGNVEYAQYVAWRDNYYDLHKSTLTEAKEKLGLAFCQRHYLRDAELSNCTNRIQAESLIFSRYVARYRALPE